MLGRLSDINLVHAATLSGGDWSADLPLTNLQVEGRYRSHPARQLTPANLAAAQLEVELAVPRAISLVAVLFHTFSLDARFRLTLAPVGGGFDDPLAYSTDWLPVFSRLFASEALDWEEPNWWTGQARPEDVDLHPRHLWIWLTPAVLSGQLRLELDDQDNPAGFFDLGGLWVASAWSPAFNFDRGRELGLETRDQVDEAPSGREFVELREPRRSLSVTWSMLADSEAQRLFDIGARLRTVRPILFAPEPGNAPSLLREAFPATFRTPPSARFTRQYGNSVTATLREIIA